MKPRVVKDFTYPRTKEELPFGPGSQAGVLVEVNSGWRTFKPVLDHEKCINCLRCWLLCPDGVISKENGQLEFDFDYCKGCGICAYECPKKAIVMVKEGAE
ncbi:MAG: pyruvate ferredoxin oxidoreductase delta subunit [Clostridia bacterium]|jgi:pyruvate ferredoxin oxidoreductase delta subunit|nr:pyruvate ferredoxin oxidoreductase delta subunit [Clostridia bacterium]MDN5323126.1 pyruvate ferredoxin oxidoreductase delta subunit [Clostridia bacterium]